MKIQVRRGVFETNSSSTHSLQLTNQTLDEVKNSVNERIKELYASSNNELAFDESMYIDDDKLILKGFPIISSEETACVYYIITNWMAKVQYLAMILNEYVSSIDGFEKEDAKIKKMHNWWDYQEPILPKLKVYERFVELIKEYSKNKGLEIKDVIFEMEESVWLEFFTFKDKNFFDEKITVNYLEDLFNTIMDDNYIITYSDEAYNPYATPSIYIF